MAEKEKFSIRLLRSFLLLHSAFWQFLFPAYLSFIAPEMLGYLKNIGQELGQLWWCLYYFVTVFGYVFACINIAFLIWHFRIKRSQTVVSENKMYRGWIFIGNLSLILALLKLIMIPVS